MFCSPHPVGMRTRLSRLDNAGPRMSPANVLRVGHCVDFLLAIIFQDLLHISRCNLQTPLDLNTAVFLLIICPDLIIHGLRCYLQNPKSFNNSTGFSVVVVNNNPSTSDYTSSHFGCKDTLKIRHSIVSGMASMNNLSTSANTHHMMSPFKHPHCF